MLLLRAYISVHQEEEKWDIAKEKYSIALHIEESKLNSILHGHFCSSFTELRVKISV